MPNAETNRFEARWETTRSIRWIGSVAYGLLVYVFPIPHATLQLLAIYVAGLAATVLVFELLRLLRAEPWIPSACVLSLCVLCATWYLAELRLGRPAPALLRIAPVDAGFSGPGFPTSYSGVPAIELPEADSGSLLVVDPSETETSLQLVPVGGVVSADADPPEEESATGR